MSSSIIIREANLEDVDQLQEVRHSVRENVLSDPNKVTNKDCEEYLFKRGKGWVFEINNNIVGFAIIDLKEKNVWALFVRPEYDNMGIGKMLHTTMINWYFSTYKKTLWAGTDPNSRAARFYKMNGWSEIGMHGKDEIKLELTNEDWNKADHF